MIEEDKESKNVKEEMQDIKTCLNYTLKESKTCREELIKVIKYVVVGHVVTILILAIACWASCHSYFYAPSDFTMTNTTTNENINHNTNKNGNEEKGDVDNGES